MIVLSSERNLQAQAPREIERVVKKVKEATISLDPRDLEVLTANTARRLLHRVYRSQRSEQVIEEFLSEARDIISEVIFITFLAGMKAAAREFHVEHISPRPQDWQKIQELRLKYCDDVTRIIRDMVTDAQVDRKVDMEYYIARANLLVQMAVWSTFNKAKLAVYRTENVIEDKERLKQLITQSPHAYRAANYKYKGWFMFKTAAEEDVCELCAIWAGVMTEDPDELPEPPEEFHPYCLPGHTRISTRGRITGITKRIYYGDLTIIHTASGHELSLTPNHPVLSPHGWIAAGLLNEGDHVVCERRSQFGIPSLADDNYEDMPSTIEEIANSFLLPPTAIRLEVPGSSEDFHGDGRDGEVTVVGTNRRLMFYKQSSVFEHLSELPFMMGDSRFRFKGLGRLKPFMQTSPAASTGIMRGLNLPDPLLPTHSGPLEQLSFMSSSNMGPSLFQSPSDAVSVNSKILRDLILRDSRGISLDKIIDVERESFQGHIYVTSSSSLRMEASESFVKLSCYVFP